MKSLQQIDKVNLFLMIRVDGDFIVSTICSLKYGKNVYSALIIS